jgi:hypothetical protein
MELAQIALFGQRLVRIVGLMDGMRELSIREAKRNISG